MRSVVLALYRAYLLMLPPGFREQWGDEMYTAAVDAMTETRTWGGSALAALRLGTDCARTFVREWTESAAAAGRRAKGAGMGRSLVQDIKFAIRSFGKAPLFAALVIGTLGLGIGANTAIFSVLHAVVLKPLPYPEPDELVSVWPGKLFSVELLDAAREGIGSFAGISLYGGAILTITEAGDPAEVFGGEVTTNHFRVLGVRPALGRDFVPEDGVPGAAPVVLLSHELWQRRFGGDPDVVGRSIDLQHESTSRRTVIGVMPLGYQGLLRGAQAWVPVIEDRASDSYGNSSFAEAAARLGPEATIETARRELATVAQRVRDEDPGQYAQVEIDRATVWPLVDRLAGSLRQSLFTLLGAVGLVLLIAAANVANLLLVRTSARSREIAVRRAIGAGRARLFRQLMTESITLGLAGGVAGVGVAWLTRDLLLGAMPSGFRVDEAGLSPAVLGFTLAVSIVASLVFGLIAAVAPVRRASSGSLPRSRTSDRRRRDWRVQGVLVSGEVALALIAVFSAGLLVSSVRQLSNVDPGFEPESVLTFRVTAPSGAYPGDEDVLRFFAEVESALNAVPGVDRAGAAGRLPTDGGVSRITINPEGFEPDESGALPDATHRLVSAGYAETVGFRLLEGRFPTETEFREGPQPTFVTRGLAERFFPDGAIGKRFFGSGGSTWLTVVGVIEDVREDALHGTVLPGVYIPHRDWAWRTMYLAVRTSGEPTAHLDAIEAAVHGVAPAVPLSRVRTLEDIVDRSFLETRLNGRLFTLFGALAVILGAIGVYGVMAYSMSLRRQEFGIRLALGARQDELVRRAVRSGLGPLTVGLVAGIAITVPVGRSLASSLEAVEATNSLALVAATGILATVALFATLLPAFRVGRVDPVRSLRIE
ncbi:MAG: ABC transporter permease [Gemmatimonadota bacterium]